MSDSLKKDDMIFFSDLDGTLIFSAAKKRAGDIVCEYKDGREISCVSAGQTERLPVMGGVIPVTTRSVEQYLRINFPGGFSPGYALVSNGGNLLINGVPDKEWREASGKTAEECRKALSECGELLQNDPHRTFELRLVDGLFWFTKSDDPAATLDRLSRGQLSGLTYYASGEKIYALPEKLNKGEAAARLIEKLGFKGRICCAGDSAPDIPLLKRADIAVMTAELYNAAGEGAFPASEILLHERAGFPDFVTESFLRLRLGVF